MLPSRFREFLTRPNATLAIANLSAALISLVTGVVAARSLGPAQRGDLAVIMFWPALFAAVFDLSIADTVTIRTSNRDAPAGDALRDGLRVALLSSTMAVVVGAAALPWLLTSEQRRLLPLSFAFIAFIPVALGATPFIGALMGQKAYGPFAWLRVFGTVAYFAVALSLAVVGSASPATLAAASLFPPLVLSIGGLFVLRQRGVLARLGSRAAGLGACLRMGLSLHPSRLAALAAAMIDRGVAARLLSSGEIGLYQIPIAVRLMAPGIAQAVAQGLMPRLAEADPAARAVLVRDAVARAIGWTLVPVVALVPLLPFIVPMCFGQPFAAAVPATILMAFSGVIEACVLVLEGAMRTLLFVRVPVLAEGTAVITSLALAPLLAWRFGIVGLAVGYLFGRAAALCVLLWGASRYLALRPGALVISTRAYLVSVIRRILSGLRRG